MLLLFQELLAHIEADHFVLQELDAVTRNSDARFCKLRFMLSGIIVKLLQDEICESIVKIEPQDDDQKQIFASSENPFRGRWNEGNSAGDMFSDESQINIGYDVDDPPWLSPELPGKKFKQKLSEPDNRQRRVSFGKTRSFVWNYFQKHPTNPFLSICTVCNKAIVRGHDLKKLGTSSMGRHLKFNHKNYNDGVHAPQKCDNTFKKTKKFSDESLVTTVFSHENDTVTKPLNSPKSNIKFAEATAKELAISTNTSFKPRKRSQKRSFVWDFFKEYENSRCKCVCTICNVVISRGNISRKLGTSKLLSHLKSEHGISKSNDNVEVSNDIDKVYKPYNHITKRLLMKKKKFSDNKKRKDLTIKKIEQKSKKNKTVDNFNPSIYRPIPTSRTSFTWKYYETHPDNILKTICKICGKIVTRGRLSKKRGTYEFTTPCMLSHLASAHFVKRETESTCSFAWDRFDCDKQKCVCKICKISVGIKMGSLSQDTLLEHLRDEHGINQENDSPTDSIAKVIPTNTKTENFLKRTKSNKSKSLIKAKRHKKNKKENFPWNYFSTYKGESLTVKCKMCGSKCSLGKDETRLSTRNMASHLELNHSIKHPKRFGQISRSFAWNYAKRDPKNNTIATCKVCNKKICSKHPGRLSLQIRYHLNYRHKIFKKPDDKSVHSSTEILDSIDDHSKSTRDEGVTDNNNLDGLAEYEPNSDTPVDAPGNKEKELNSLEDKSFENDETHEKKSALSSTENRYPLANQSLAICDEDNVIDNCSKEAIEYGSKGVAPVDASHYEEKKIDDAEPITDVENDENSILEKLNTCDTIVFQSLLPSEKPEDCERTKNFKEVKNLRPVHVKYDKSGLQESFQLSETLEHSVTISHDKINSSTILDVINATNDEQKLIVQNTLRDGIENVAKKVDLMRMNNKKHSEIVNENRLECKVDSHLASDETVKKVVEENGTQNHTHNSANDEFITRKNKQGGVQQNLTINETIEMKFSAITESPDCLKGVTGDENEKDQKLRVVNGREQDANDGRIEQIFPLTEPFVKLGHSEVVTDKSVINDTRHEKNMKDNGENLADYNDLSNLERPSSSTTTETAQ